MQEFVDQMNITIRLSGIPRRIVSLVPSQTELLFSLGLEERVVGITKFCIHPNDWFRSKKRVGGTKDANFEKIRALNPDLIIGNKEENDKSNIEELSSIAPIWMSDIFKLDDSLDMIHKIGEMVGASEKAHHMIASIRSEFNSLEDVVQIRSSQRKPSALYLIWKDPYLSAGKNTFIDDLLSRCGFVNFTKEERYPEVILNSNSSPDFVFLSSEPYPFKEKHIRQIQEIYPTAKIMLVDGEMFSWYGSRLLQAPAYFIELLNSL
jgi:ABC-type Fe3+-hydroxamate transport system substrate-binding protein